MTLHFFFVPARRPEPVQTELNALLARGRVVAIRRDWLADGADSGWAVCVEVTEAAAPLPADLRAGAPARRGQAVDYKDTLSPADFSLFASLRTLRKQLAERDGVPVYAVFSNEQLAQIATNRPGQASALAALDGIGDARLQRFGAEVLACVGAHAEPAAGPSPASP